MSNAELKSLVTSLVDRVGFLEKLLKVEGEWITPNQASEIWPYSTERICCEIRIAEDRRVARQKSDLKYGEHYVSTLFPYDYRPEAGLALNPKKKRNTWMVHRENFWKVVSMPIDQRHMED